MPQDLENDLTICMRDVLLAWTGYEEAAIVYQMQVLRNQCFKFQVTPLNQVLNQSSTMIARTIALANFGYS